MLIHDLLNTGVFSITPALYQGFYVLPDSCEPAATSYGQEL